MPLSSFVGRRELLATLVDLLGNQGIRLVTLCGTGGVGKTRMATETGRLLSSAFPAGTVFVTLAELSSPGDVVPHIASTLGVGAGAALVAHLRDQRMLLILDNLEHVLDAAPAVAELAEACPNLCLLATSREPLHLRGEQRIAVTPLRVPAGADVEIADLLQIEAVQLFLQRARSVQHDFALTDDNAAAVASLCRKLEGLPLAIELAAARIGEFSPWELLLRLEHALDLLSDGPRDVSPRQSSIRATMDWSYRLLSERERAIFSSLGVFRGGFTVDAAREVSGMTGEDVTHLPVHLLALAEKSLVNRDPSSHDARFTLLEPLRAYALDMAREAGTELEVKGRHAKYFQRLAEKAEIELWGECQGEWFGRLALEGANLSAALEYAFSRQDFGTGLSILACLWRFWIWQGNYPQWRSWLEEGLAAGEAVDPAVRARAFFAAAFLAQHQADYHRGQFFGEQSLALARKLDDPLAIRHALSVLGLCQLYLGEAGEAVVLFRETVDLCHRLNNQQYLPPSMFNLGMALAENGSVPEGVSYIEEALRLFRDAGEKYISVTARCYLGHLEANRKHLRQARSLFLESLQISQETNYQVGLTHALEGVAVIDALVGRFERSAQLIGTAATLRRQMSAPPSREDRRPLDAAIAAGQRSLGQGRWDQLAAQGRATPLAEAILHAMSTESSGLHPRVHP